MPKHPSWSAPLSILALLVLCAALAAGASAPRNVAACPALSSPASTAGVAPPAPFWKQSLPVACGPGCPGSGAGTDAACRNKNTGDACGSGGVCLQVLSPTCPRSAVQCTCYTRE